MPEKKKMTSKKGKDYWGKGRYFGGTKMGGRKAFRKKKKKVGEEGTSLPPSTSLWGGGEKNKI